MTGPCVVVCGSLNMDVIVQSDRRPVAGETVLGGKVSFLPGGKGLNQAVSAARLGASTAMLGAVGGDAFGRTLLGVLAENRVDRSGVKKVPHTSSGVALIQIAQGDNAITGVSGANMKFLPSMVRRSPRRGEVWVAQFETPLATTRAAFLKARAAGATTVLNLAPMVRHSAALLELADIAVLNEIELSQAISRRITAKSPTSAIAKACRGLSKRTVIATLGARGCVIVSKDGVAALPAFKAKVVDTTGAGDCFVGALAARMAAGLGLLEAARYANAAASCAVERLGAAPSMPTPREVAARLSRA